MKKKYLLHDLSPEPEQQYLSALSPEWILISASKPAAKCIGCFKCWLKTPGLCTFHDGREHLGSDFLNSEELLIISRSLYGGFSPHIKRIWDRSIPGVLPFFTLMNEELHHSKRFPNNTKLRVIFYNGAEMTDEEKEQAENLIAANALNFHAKSAPVLFLDTPDKLGEVIA